MATLSYDAEFKAFIAPFEAVIKAAPKHPVGDVENRRNFGASGFAAALAAQTPIPDVTWKNHELKSADGTVISITEFRKDKAPSQNTKAIYHVHGGGMIIGSVEMFSRHCASICSETGYPVFSVEYRLAPEAPHPKPIEDCWAGLQWLHANASTLGVDNSKLVVLGESAGGGLAAALCLMARDKTLSPPVCKQVLVFPMLDDRNQTPYPSLEPFAVWSCDDNKTGWGALIGPNAGSPDLDAVSPYAAPARAKSLAGLPPTFIEVGNLDIFIYEDVQYASRLIQDGVQTELHVYPGVPHGFQMFAPDIAVSKASRANMLRAITET